MSRWRPPASPAAAVITADGERRLRAELQQLWKVERPAVTAAVHEAAKNGDRSENGDYIYGKRRLREIDRRVRFLQKRLAVLRIVDSLPTDTRRIYFGAWVTLEDESGHAQCLRLVGPDEFDLARGQLSIDAPLARALLGKQADDTVTVTTPTGLHSWHVLAVAYTAP